jgi:hypothetical protein
MSKSARRNLLIKATMFWRWLSIKFLMDLVEMSLGRVPREVYEDIAREAFKEVASETGRDVASEKCRDIPSFTK